MRTGNAKEHVFKGSVIAKNYIKVYQGRLKGQGYYGLVVNCKPKIGNDIIQAIREKILSDNIGNDIIEDNWVNKKYWFICHKHGSTYKLIRWQEVV